MNKKSSILVSSIAACAIFASAFAFNGFAIGNTKAESIPTQATTISQSTEPSGKTDTLVNQDSPAVSKNSQNVSDVIAAVNKSAANQIPANASKSANCPKTNNVAQNQSKTNEADTNAAQNSNNQPTTTSFNNIKSADIMNNLQTIVYQKNCKNSTANNVNYSALQSRLNTLLKSKAGTSATKAPTTSKPAGSTTKPAPAPTVSGDFAAFQKRVVQLVNAERAKQGLKPLTMNAQVNKTATLKSQDMAKLGYFDHNSPTYGSPFDMMKKYGISYRTAGENIAMGQTTPEQVMKGWMNSPGHRANILKASFTQIGVGVAKNSSGGIYWTQQFIG